MILLILAAARISPGSRRREVKWGGVGEQDILLHFQLGKARMGYIELLQNGRVQVFGRNR